MNSSKSSCDDDRLRLLLANQLPPELERDAEQHVVECRDCKLKLESLAGDGSWWSSVKDCFTRESARLSGSHVCPAASSTGRDHHTENTETFEADFVVDFLQPCDQPGTLGRLDEFEILKVIGRGGMGIVLKGYQRELGRHVAVKVMTPPLAMSGPARARFAREARAAAAIVHPHVMAIHSISTSGRLPYLVMPYVACESLQQRIDRDGPLNAKEVLRIGLQVATGLAAAHAQGLVHRDVKPANILLERSVDRVMLTDFGLARAVDDVSLTRTGVIAGTPQYMSPEQARGESVDQRSDLFSLGSVIYAMCTGHPPFRGETSYGVLRRITDSEPRSIREINPEIPAWLETIVRRLLTKSLEERFQSAEQVADLLQRCLAHVQQPTQVELPRECQDSNAVKHAVPLRYVFTSAVALFGLIAAVAAFQFGDRFRLTSPSANETAESETSSTTTTPESVPSQTDLSTSADEITWDASVNMLQSYRSDFEEFESAIKQNWNHSIRITKEQ